MGTLPWAPGQELRKQTTPMSEQPSEQPTAEAGTMDLMRRVYRDYISRYLVHLWTGVFCMVLVAALTALNAWLMEPVLDRIFIAKDVDMLLLIPFVVIVASAVKSASAFGQSYLINGISVRISADAQNDLYTKLIDADLAVFHKETTGSLISRFLTDANMLSAATGKALISLVKDSLMLVFLVGVMIEKDWQLALIALGVLPLAAYPLSRFSKRIRKIVTQLQERVGGLTGALEETFSGIRLVKASVMEDRERARVGRSVGVTLDTQLKSVRISAVISPMMEFLGGLAVALVIWYGGSRVMADEMTTGAFVAFITALLMAYQPMKQLANLNTNIQTGAAAAKRVFEMLDRTPTVIDRPDAQPLAVQQGEIRFQNVDFGYEEHGPNALCEASFVARAGKSLALVGPSGGGKSTVLNLILRFYDVKGGSISIDGQDISSVTMASLRSNIGLVSQEAILFDDTVRANIAYCRPDATEEQIIAAARGADADGFIRKLPQGYDTVVGPRGGKLSGGQKQRIAIARAMLQDAPILLLDEATSALDSESEKNVQAALERLMANRTTIIIAHRLSTINKADCILVLEAGRVVESGNHAELLAHSGLYARLYNTQFATAV